MKIIPTLAGVLLAATATASFVPAAIAATSPAPAATTAPAKMATVKKPAPARAPRTAKSLACSKTADSKGLHGKPREAFMRSCNKAA